ncbi:hypothetical protein [Azospirillum doebereinerae]|uniref:Fungal lipase-like domain-containing protein n=1 Tax=Azospirillum doebereinerae TaxID=92933 RepID=A0A3S0WNC1_9PROT|nr:hypothetical protein [Azospirillum doebereinerae]MCG5242544.1 hypothetical protein [Azospirillum doebereinerae]RUQ74042.1 hypothetical protein EJ913_06645 [Azospirillum doebereinerae]
MHVTVLDLAVAANTVYNFNKGRGNDADTFASAGTAQRAPDGYQTVLTEEEIDVGFFGAVYQRPGAAEYILSFRGTVAGEGSSGRLVGNKNIVTDIGLYAIEKLPSCRQAAHRLLEHAQLVLRNATPILCGHSLGGAIATVIAVETASPCCAFNAPTVSKMVRGGTIHGPFVRVTKESLPAIERQIINFNLQWDPISKSSKAVGKVIKLPATLSAGGHSQDKVVANIRSSCYASMSFFDLVE